MPRVSIIIPHRNDDLRLEETLISVLENRPQNSEILVSHDGSYRDAYDLSREVVFVVTNPGSSVLRKINEATLASCSPIVHVVFDGVMVSDQWCESAAKFFQEPQVGAVSPKTLLDSSPLDVIGGLNVENPGQRTLVRRLHPESCAPTHRCDGPLLACGFYRRKVLLSLNGWLETVVDSVADVELALALRRLQIQCVYDCESQVSVPRSLAIPTLSTVAVRQLASLAVAYQQIEAGLSSAALGGVRQLVNGRALPISWAKALAWGRGMFDGKFAARVDRRLQLAAEQLSTVDGRSAAVQNSKLMESSDRRRPHSRRGELRKAA